MTTPPNKEQKHHTKRYVKKRFTERVASILSRLPIIQTPVTFRDFCGGTASLSLDVSPLNLVS